VKSFILALIVLMSITGQAEKEIDMAPKNNQIMKEEQGNKPAVKSNAPFQTPTTNGFKASTPKPPAWLSGGGAGAGGGQNEDNSWTDTITSAVAATNTQGGSQWLAVDENKPAPQPAFVNPPKIQPGFQTPAYGGSYNPTSSNPVYQPPQIPAWMKAVPSAIAAANTQGGGQWFSMDNEPAPQPAFVNPQVPVPAWMGQSQYDPALMVPTYQGQPVNQSFSDTLRGLTPPKMYGGFQTPPNSMYYAPTKSSKPGFSSQYGGNWGGGRGGGGGGGGGGWGNDGGGGYGYGDNPAWAQDMGLYNWKFG